MTALDISPRLLGEARRRAEAEEVPIGFDLGDAQALPYEERAFDVVTSSFGIIFAPDRRARAGELARGCRPRGRLGLTTWLPRLALKRLYERFQERPPAADAEAWGREEEVRGLLGRSFELEISVGTWVLEGESPEGVYEFMVDAAPPMAALLGMLAAERRDEFREALLEYWREFEVEEGVREPRDYLLVLGTRR